MATHNIYMILHLVTGFGLRSRDACIGWVRLCAIRSKYILQHWCLSTTLSTQYKQIAQLLASLSLCVCDGCSLKLTSPHFRFPFRGISLKLRNTCSKIVWYVTCHKSNVKTLCSSSTFLRFRATDTFPLCHLNQDVFFLYPFGCLRWITPHQVTYQYASTVNKRQ